tara:strand:- start:573 stop:734 length:162 start_codon:yes stop_codon:yes gene_type:complete
MSLWFEFILIVAGVAIVIAILWQCFFNAYRRHRESVMRRFIAEISVGKKSQLD